MPPPGTDRPANEGSRPGRFELRRAGNRASDSPDRGFLPCGIEDALAEVCTEAVTSIPGAELADIMLRRDDMVFSVGATAPLAATLDAVQLQLGEGPCLQAANGAAVVCADDFGNETRWPRWCAEATALGVGSAVSYRLYSRGRGERHCWEPVRCDRGHLWEPTTAAVMITG